MIQRWLEICAAKGLRAVREAAASSRVAKEILETIMDRGKQLVPAASVMDEIKWDYFAKFKFLRINALTWQADGDDRLPVIQCHDPLDPAKSPILARLETIDEARTKTYDHLRRMTLRNDVFCRVSRALARRDLREGGTVLALGLSKEENERGERVAWEFAPVDWEEIAALRARVQGSSQPQPKPASQPDQSQPKPAPRWNSPSR